MSAKSAFQKMLKASKKIRETNESKQGKFEKIDWFIPKDGKVRLRLLPNPKDADQFFWKQVQTHFLPVKKKNGQMAQIPVRCLQDFDEACPLCHAFAKLSKSKNEDTAETATRLKPLTRYLVNVIVYDEANGSAKVQPYAMQSSVFDGVTAIMEELGVPAYDLQEGRDLKLIRKNKNGRTEYQVLPVAASSSVPSKLMPLVKAATDLETLYTENEGERMREYLEAVGFESDDDEDEVPKSKKKKGKPVEDEDEDEDIDTDEEEADEDDDGVEEEDDADESDDEDEDSEDDEDSDDDEEEDEDDEEDEDSDDDEDEDEESDDEDEDEEEDDEDEEEEKPKAKSKPTPRERAEAAKKKTSKKAPPSKKKAMSSATKAMRT